VIYGNFESEKEIVPDTPKTPPGAKVEPANQVNRCRWVREPTKSPEEGIEYMF
jgi:hypothetical protein